MSRLDNLLEAIHPAKTFYPLLRNVDDAVNGFPVAQASVRDEEAMRNLLLRFFVHIDGIALSSHRRWIDPGHDWSRCAEIIGRTHGEDGVRLAVYRSVHGVDGGLRRVLMDIAAGYAEMHAENKVAALVTEFWNRMPAPERFEVVAEYRRNWGHLLPADVLEDSEARMLAHFPRFLEAHPKLLRALGRSGRR